MNWMDCRMDDCDFSVGNETVDRGPAIMEAHYLSHIAEDLQAMRVSQFHMVKEIRAISSSGFLNPRGPGETPQDVQERIERRREAALG